MIKVEDCVWQVWSRTTERLINQDYVLTHEREHVPCTLWCHWCVCCSWKTWKKRERCFFFFFFNLNYCLNFSKQKQQFLTCQMQQIFTINGNNCDCLCVIEFYSSSYPLMLTKRSSAALWMWNTSSLNRQRQVELCRASFHRDNAAASLFSAAWHRIKPTERVHTGRMSLSKQALI